MASVWVGENKKGSGIWYIFIARPGQPRKKVKVGKDKRLAERVAEQTRAELLVGKLGIAKDEAKPFREYAEIWKATVLPATCKPSTQTDYKSILKNHILPVFKDRPIDKIKKMEVKTFLLGKLNDGYAQSTVTHIKNALGGILNLAVDDEAIPGNPAHRLGKIFSDKINQPAKVVPLSRADLSTLLNAFAEKQPEYYHLILTLARSGLRIGEALALKWDDLDFDDRFIHVQRNFSRGEIQLPKNGKSRNVDMSNQLAEALRKLSTTRKAQTLKNGWHKLPEWLFINSKGNPVNKDNFRNRIFNPLLDELEIRKIRIHDLRHTFASHLIEAGWPMAYVRDQLGHHSIKVTVDIYGHLSPEGNKAAVNSLDDEGY